MRISLNVTEAQQARWLAVAMKMLSSGQTLTGARIALCNETEDRRRRSRPFAPARAKCVFPTLLPAAIWCVSKDRAEYGNFR